MAAPTVAALIACALTMSSAMVSATAVPDMVPKTLSTVAMAKARTGDRTRVETTVAMALGASVQPLTNSAARINPRTIKIPRDNSMKELPLYRDSKRRPESTRFLFVFEDDTLDHVSHVLALVRGRFHQVVDLAPPYQIEQVVRRSKQFCHRSPQKPVGLVLEPIDLDAVLQNVVFAQPAQLRHDLLDLFDLLQDHSSQRLHMSVRLSDSADHEPLGGSLDEIHNIVKSRSEQVYVLAIDRRDETAVKPGQDIMGDLIPFVLQPLHALRVLDQRVEFVHSLDQQPCRYHQIVRSSLEEFEEAGLLRNEA